MEGGGGRALKSSGKRRNPNNQVTGFIRLKRKREKIEAAPRQLARRKKSKELLRRKGSPARRELGRSEGKPSRAGRGRSRREWGPLGRGQGVGSAPSGLGTLTQPPR